jgi:ligand-binding SRPBCC domain-containing protein
VREYVLERTQVVPAAPDVAFVFVADARNLDRITPPWLRFTIVEGAPTLERGTRLRYQIRLFGIPIRWQTEIVEWSPPHVFTGIQLRGPFKLWEHTYRLTLTGDGTEIYDRVRYGLAFGRLGSAVRSLLVRGWLDEIFDYRARTLSTASAWATPIPVRPNRRARLRADARAAAAGVAATAVWAAAEPLLGRIFGTPYSDVRLLGRPLSRRHWRATGLALHLANGAAAGVFCHRIGLRRTKHAVLLFQAENVAAWPLMIAVDRWHPDRRSGAWPPLLRNPRVFGQEVVAHAIVGVVLGRLLRD